MVRLLGNLRQDGAKPALFARQSLLAFFRFPFPRFGDRFDNGQRPRCRDHQTVTHNPPNRLWSGSAPSAGFKPLTFSR
jgi:hypothetical protein